jgi:hypothetical protein
LLGEVLEAAVVDDGPLVHHLRRYGRFTAEGSAEAGTVASDANGGRR